MRNDPPRCTTGLMLLALATAGCSADGSDADGLRGTVISKIERADAGVGRVAHAASDAVDDVNIAAATHDAVDTVESVAKGTADVVHAGRVEAPGVAMRLGDRVAETVPVDVNPVTGR